VSVDEVTDVSKDVVPRYHSSLRGLLHGKFKFPFTFRFSLSSVPFGNSGVFTRFMSFLISAQ
jgi:hypothetical protein